jgi:endonuclease/exonuclease/phosphatase (EEP) superfamily protein YafD
MDNRPLQATTVKVGGEEVTIINLHLLFTTYYSYVEHKVDPIHQFPRVAAWKRGQGAALAKLRELPGRVIVAGDFNDHDSGPDIAGFSQAFDDANAQTSFGPGTTQGLPFVRVRIDHIFSKELRPLRSWVVDIPRLSDHSPVVAEFALSNP